MCDAARRFATLVRMSCPRGPLCLSIIDKATSWHRTGGSRKWTVAKLEFWIAIEHMVITFIFFFIIAVDRDQIYINPLKYKQILLEFCTITWEPVLRGPLCGL